MFIIKKIISIILIATLICVSFIACSSKNENTPDTSDQISTDEAVIKEGEAIKYLEDNYTKEELGLADVKEDYQLMVSTYGIEHDGGKYVKIVANVMTENEGVTTEDGQQTYTMKSLAEFLISFDGKTVLKRSIDEEEYTKLEVKTPDYSAKGETSKAK